MAVRPKASGQRMAGAIIINTLTLKLSCGIFMKRITLSLLCTSALLVSACSGNGTILGAIAGGGVMAVQQRGFTDGVTDFEIQAQINNLWFQHSVDSFGKLDMTVNEGRVLLTGVVQDPEERVEAVRLAWQPKGVKQVINEIRVAQSEGIAGFAKDSWLSAQIRTKITFDGDILSINYSIDTVQGVVYLLGIAQHREELNRVIEAARTVSGVKKVVSYVRIASEEPHDDEMQALEQDKS